MARNSNLFVRYCCHLLKMTAVLWICKKIQLSVIGYKSSDIFGAEFKSGAKLRKYKVWIMHRKHKGTNMSVKLKLKTNGLVYCYLLGQASLMGGKLTFTFSLSAFLSSLKSMAGKNVSIRSISLRDNSHQSCWQWHSQSTRCTNFVQTFPRHKTPRAIGKGNVRKFASLDRSAGRHSSRCKIPGTLPMEIKRGRKLVSSRLCDPTFMTWPVSDDRCPNFHPPSSFDDLPSVPDGVFASSIRFYPVFFYIMVF